MIRFSICALLLTFGGCASGGRGSVDIIDAFSIEHTGDATPLTMMLKQPSYTHHFLLDYLSLTGQAATDYKNSLIKLNSGSPNLLILYPQQGGEFNFKLHFWAEHSDPRYLELSVKRELDKKSAETQGIDITHLDSSRQGTLRTIQHLFSGERCTARTGQSNQAGVGLLQLTQGTCERAGRKIVLSDGTEVEGFELSCTFGLRADMQKENFELLKITAKTGAAAEIENGCAFVTQTPTIIGNMQISFSQ